MHETTMTPTASSAPNESGGTRLRVLFLAKQFPWPLNVGSRQRIFHLMRGIAAAHHVSAIAYDAPPSKTDIDEFKAASGCDDITIVPRPEVALGARDEAPINRQVSRAIRAARRISGLAASPLPGFVRNVWSDDLVRAIASAARAEAFDLVYATQSWMAEHAKAAGLTRIAVDVDDLVSLISRQRLATSPWTARKPLSIVESVKDVAYERSLPARFSHVIVAKNEDQNFFNAPDRGRVSIVPNGIKIPIRPLEEPALANRILFVGTLGYEPNIDAIRWFAREILPLIWRERPDVHLDVAGFGSGAAVEDVLADPRCALHESPPDLTPLYAGAAVVIAPVRIGGGTRIKILEALALGRALVSTVFAAEGLGLRDRIDLEYGDSPGAIAALCVALLADEARRRTLATTGRQRVAEQFDWNRIELLLPKLITRFVAHEDSVASETRDI